MVFKLRCTLFNHIQRLSLAFHDSTSVGDSLYRVTWDTYCAQSLFNGGLIPAITASVTLVGIAAAMEAAQVPLPIVYGHHDLLPANFLEDAAGRLWLIDYENAGFCRGMFDLAGAAANAGMATDEAEALLAAYFGAAPDAATRRAFAAMRCASLAREAMWAMVSEIFLAAPGADYDAHARDYLDRLEAALEVFQSTYGKITT
jgi:thiamine kinase-like enzyme